MCSAVLSVHVRNRNPWLSLSPLHTNNHDATLQSGISRNVTVRLTSNDIKNGTTLEIDGAPWRVLEFLHVKPGKGAAFVRSKIKNLVSGTTQEKTFRAGEPLQAAEVMKTQCQYTYSEARSLGQGKTFVFMNMETFDEIRVPRDDDWALYLREGTDCDLVFFNEEVISVEPPQNMTLKVTRADPAIKGNTSAGAKKPALLETGVEIEVPIFISEGDEIRVDTREGKYLGKA